MKYALNLAENGRILSVTFEEFAAEGMPVVDELPEGDTADYLYVDGQYVHDPLPKEEPEPKPTDAERIAELEEALALLLSGVTE